MTEQNLWNTLRPVLRREGFDPQRIETPAGSGVPDVDTRFGWIELKDVAAPLTERGGYPLEHFTKQQRAWLLRRWLVGGSAWLLVRARRGQHDAHWFLIDGESAFRMPSRPTSLWMADNVTKLTIGPATALDDFWLAIRGRCDVAS